MLKMGACHHSRMWASRSAFLPQAVPVFFQGVAQDSDCSFRIVLGVPLAHVNGQRQVGRPGDQPLAGFADPVEGARHHALKPDALIVVI